MTMATMTTLIRAGSTLGLSATTTTSQLHAMADEPRKPRIYLCGPVDALPDCGRAWRTRAAEAVRAAGMEPVWPNEMLRALDAGRLDAEIARERWKDGIDQARAWISDLNVSALSHVLRRHDPRLDELARLLACDAVLCWWDERAGHGTRAELAFAEWVGKPIALLDCDRSGVDAPVYEDVILGYCESCLPDVVARLAAHFAPSKPLPRVVHTGPVLPRVDPDLVAEALGAERVEP